MPLAITFLLLLGTFLALCDTAFAPLDVLLPLRISTDASGIQADRTSGAPSISPDGRYITFVSAASNLVPGDAGTGYSQVYLKDIQSGAITLVSNAPDGTASNGISRRSSLSADGRYVAFDSTASDLVPDDTNKNCSYVVRFDQYFYRCYEIYVKDMLTGQIIRVSNDYSSGGQPNGTQPNSHGPSISADGQYVAFSSDASNLVYGDGNNLTGRSDVFITDIQSGVTNMVSTDSSGSQPVTYGTNGSPSISADGRYVAFSSRTSDLVTGDSNGTGDVFIKETSTGVTTRISTDAAGNQGNGGSDYPSISQDGRYVAFSSGASNLVPDDTANLCNDGTYRCSEIFLKDTLTGDITRVSNDYATGGQPNNSGYASCVSVDGRYVAFASWATNLVPGGFVTGNHSNVYVWSKDAGTAALVSADAAGNAGNGNSYFGEYMNPDRVISADGQLVTFQSYASDLVISDTNYASDVFLAAGTPTITTRKAYWPWFDGIGGQNWLIMANPSDSAYNQSFEASVSGLVRDLDPFALTGGKCPASSVYSTPLCAPGQVPPGMAIIPEYSNLRGGPVVATARPGQKPLLASQRILWGGRSLEEIPGIDEERLSDHYYWPWYDHRTAGFENWVLISNPGEAAAYFRIKIAGEEITSGSLAPGEVATPTFPGVMNGPVEVQAWSDQVGGNSPAGVIASQRVLTQGGTAFNEVGGIPASELSNHYLWTWYDSGSSGAMDWLLLANPGEEPVEYSIKIAGNNVASGALQGTTDSGNNGSQLVFPGVMGGPVEVTATGDLVASKRTLWGPSFEEVPGYQFSSLASHYHWTWYDSQSHGANNWILIHNPNPGPVDYSIIIAGSVVASGTLQAAGDPLGADMAMPVFTGVMGGPVEVSSTGGNVMVSQRVLWNGYFNEVLGTVLE